MSKIIYPLPISKNAKIAVTAPSSGVRAPSFQKRLDLINSQWRARGYQVIEGKNLRSQWKDASASASERCSEFMEFWQDPTIEAIIPPWGGELLVEILPLIDFVHVSKQKPKWILGYSDISTLLFAITLRTHIATAHGSNWMDLVDDQVFNILQIHKQALMTPETGVIHQEGFPKFQERYILFDDDVGAKFNIETPTKWKVLSGKPECSLNGRLIGGCLDTIIHLIGTPFGDLRGFIHDYSTDGIILYLENCELKPVQIVRALWQLRNAGWFDGIKGLVLGRSAGPDSTSPEQLSYFEAVQQSLEGLPFPTILDADVGHKPPQLVLINGAIAQVNVSQGMAIVEQTLK